MVADLGVPMIKIFCSSKKCAAGLNSKTCENSKCPPWIPSKKAWNIWTVVVQRGPESHFQCAWAFLNIYAQISYEHFPQGPRGVATKVVGRSLAPWETSSRPTPQHFFISFRDFFWFQKRPMVHTFHSVSIHPLKCMWTTKTSGSHYCA